MKTTLSKLTKKSWYESCESEARPGSVDMGKQGGRGGVVFRGLTRDSWCRSCMSEARPGSVETGWAVASSFK